MSAPITRTESHALFMTFTYLESERKHFEECSESDRARHIWKEIVIARNAVERLAGISLADPNLERKGR